MPTPANGPVGSPAPESSGRVRHLYLVELLLGAGLVGLVVLIFLTGNRRDRDESGTGSGHGKIVTLTEDNWQHEVAHSSVPVVVDFYATWCEPCRALAPAIDRIAARYDGKVKVARLDIEQAPVIA